MRRRLQAAATAVVAGCVALGAGTALAAKTTGKHSTVKPVVVRCNLTLSTTPPAGSASVDQPPSQGSQYGNVSCPAKAFGGGVESDAFTVPDSGDTVGSYVDYFHAGSIHGEFDLTPIETTFDPSVNFLSESWQGTWTVTGGTGVYKGITEKRGTGAISCTSPDTVHLTCSEKIEVNMP